MRRASGPAGHRPLTRLRLASRASSVVALAFIVVLAAACDRGSGSQAPGAKSTAAVLVDHHQGLSTPNAVKAGAVLLTLTNESQKPYTLLFGTLRTDGARADDVQQAVDRGDRIEDHVDIAGSVVGVEPGRKAQAGATVEGVDPSRRWVFAVQPGTASLAEDPAPDPTEVFVSDVAVVGRGDRPPPAPNGALTAREFAFAVDRLPEAAPVGSGRSSQTIRIANQGTTTHRFVVVRLEPGRDVDQAIAAMARPLADLGWLSPGRQALAPVALESGEYALVCPRLDPNGRPHHTLGMKTTFRVP